MNIRALQRAGFTLLELIVVVAVAGLLAVVIVPRYARARTASETSACIDNLRQVDNAIHQYSLVENVVPTNPVGYADISNYIGRDLACPTAGTNATFATTYKLVNCQSKPVCLVVPQAHFIPN